MAPGAAAEVGRCRISDISSTSPRIMRDLESGSQLQTCVLGVVGVAAAGAAGGSRKVRGVARSAQRAAQHHQAGALRGMANGMSRKLQHILMQCPGWD